MHGSLSVEKEHYAETDNVTIQCDTGYDLVGSSNIICSENRTWYPGIPSCKTVSGAIQGTSMMSTLNIAVLPKVLSQTRMVSPGTYQDAQITRYALITLKHHGELEGADFSTL